MWSRSRPHQRWPPHLGSRWAAPPLCPAVCCNDSSFLPVWNNNLPRHRVVSCLHRATLIWLCCKIHFLHFPTRCLFVQLELRFHVSSVYSHLQHHVLLVLIRINFQYLLALFLDLVQELFGHEIRKCTFLGLIRY